MSSLPCTFQKTLDIRYYKAAHTAEIGVDSARNHPRYPLPEGILGMNEVSLNIDND
jgi:hypothetical protein